MTNLIELQLRLANDLDKILSDQNNPSDGLMSFAGGGGKLLGGFGLALDVATKVTGGLWFSSIRCG